MCARIHQLSIDAVERRGMFRWDAVRICSLNNFSFVKWIRRSVYISDIYVLEKNGSDLIESELYAEIPKCYNLGVFFLAKDNSNSIRFSK